MQKFIALLLLIAVSLLAWLVFFKPSDTVYLPKISQVETRIIERDTVIKTIERTVIQTSRNNDILEAKIDALVDSIDSSKQALDTVRIIQYQDTAINVLKQSNDTLKKVINLKDSIIVGKDYIIESKDTIIDIHQRSNVKFKRQRNALIGAVALLIGAIVVK